MPNRAKREQILQLHCQDFSKVPRIRVEEALRLMRTYQLGAGDKIDLVGDGNTADTLYLVDGQISLQINRSMMLQVRYDNKPCEIFLPARSKARITALKDSTLCRVDENKLDYLLCWDNIAQAGTDVGVGIDVASRIRQLRNPLVFQRLPMENIIELFQRMESVDVSKSEVVIEQGERGDYFYIIESGEAEVLQRGADGINRQLAVLTTGHSFGEDALVSNEPRNATIRMRTDGVLLRLDRDNFEPLIQQPMIDSVSPAVGKVLLETGDRQGLDVRDGIDVGDYRLPGVIKHVPWTELRKRIRELDRKKKYLVYCSNGSRGAIATLLLSQQGFDAINLQGGLREWSQRLGH